jgi:integrase
MHKRVWIFQYKKEVAAKGEADASWYVGWYDGQGKRHAESCGPGSRGKNLAEKRLRRIQSELDMGSHHPPSKMLWADFRKQYEEQVLSRLEIGSQGTFRTAFDAFERHTKVLRVEAINTQMIDAFVASRRKDAGKKKKCLLSPATVNKDLRMIKAALKRAVEWGYLPTMPKIRMVREPVKIPRFVTAEHFELIYSKACDLAKVPDQKGQKYTAAQWWRALVVTAYMTGLRIKELMAIRREDLDFEKGTLITRASDNKGKRDEILRLHPVVIEHLRQLEGTDRFPLRWPHDPRYLWVEFGRIQREAGIHLTCSGEHEHTKACHIYGFHDFRRAFATVNAPRLKPETLQKLMRHRSYITTLGYINLASQLDDAITSMPVPKVLQKDDAKDGDVASEQPKKEPDDQ